MVQFAKEILPVDLADEMKQSYLDYAMSVIVSRALPDVRDGLKPVHRRVLYAMDELSNHYNHPYKKSARIVGDVIGKYHPHGDAAVYDTIVRMAQSFSLRYPLVDGQGNFGSVDGDAPAAMRYTEIRMNRIAHELLTDIDKETVEFAPNYDGSEREPTVLPSKIPNLLINGSSGIAVGMATNIPPHNLTEVINACLAYIDHPEITIDGLIAHLPGPDFPTAGKISGIEGIREAYHHGRGRVVMRARTHVEEIDRGGRQSLVVTELPYQVNKARLLERIADLVKEKKLEGISEVRDESDKDGLRVVIELKRGEMPDIILNNLFQYTDLQSAFNINMVALMDGQPKLLNLKDLISSFVAHRREIVTRRTLFDLRKARERAHILEGLSVALTNIDAIVALIRTTNEPGQAKKALMERTWLPGIVSEMKKEQQEDLLPTPEPATWGLQSGGYLLSEVQTQAILELRLQRLTGLERDKILQEYRDLLEKIRCYLAMLRTPEKLMAVIREELEQIREQFGDARRTELLSTHQTLAKADLIMPHDVVITLSHVGYVKSQPLDSYTAQRRGGKGKMAAATREEDFIDKLVIAHSHDTILCFSSRGKVYWLKVHDIPEASRISKGRPFINLLSLEQDERINAILPVRDFSDSKFVFMATQKGKVKKTPLSEFSRPMSRGIIAIALGEDDRLIGASLTDGSQEILLINSHGKAIRFREDEVRAVGRSAQGVRGIRLTSDQRVIAMIIVREGSVLTATERGYGKRTAMEEYPVQGRDGQGVIDIKTSSRNGRVIGAILVKEEDEIMLISSGGNLVRIPAADVSIIGRNTQGVKLISVDADEKLVGLAQIVDETT